MEKYEELYKRSIMKFDNCYNNRKIVTTKLLQEDPNTFYNKLFYNLNQANDACELIIKAICELFKIDFKDNNYAYNIYERKLSDKIKINNNYKKIFKEINILYTNNIELKQSNKFYKIIYYNNKDNYPYNIVTLDSLDAMINIYNHFYNFYLKNINRNSKYLELSYNELMRIQNIVFKDHINNSNNELYYIKIDKSFKYVIENILNFILEYNKVDNFEKMNVYNKIIKVLDISNDISIYKNLICDICCKDDLKSYLDDISLRNIFNNVKEFYDFVENNEF